MTLEQQQAVHMASENRILGREDREQERAIKLLGQLIRNGKVIY